MITSWNEAEEDALQGLPWIAQLIYLRGLRRFMDFATGIVGERRGISRQMLRETVYVERIRGRHTPPDTSEKAIRAALEALESAGLIERTGESKRLIFRLLLADTDQSVSNMRGRSGADEGPTMRGRGFDSSSNNLAEMNSRSGAVAAPAMRGPPPESGVRKDMTTPNGVVVENSRFRRAPCPHQKIIEMYHRHCPANPQVRSWEGERPRKLAARWKDHPDLEWWDGFLAYVGESAFLTGRTNGARGPFTPDLEWIISPRNFQRINEGQYHGIRASS